MSRNIIKVLDKGFSDISAGDKMLISSPEKIADFIYAIPKGSFFTIKELRRGLALKAGADKTCPVTTGIFLRMAIEQNKDDVNFPTGELLRGYQTKKNPHNPTNRSPLSDFQRGNFSSENTKVYLD